MSNKMSLLPAWIVGSRLIFQSVKNPKLAAVARKQRFAARPAGWRGGLRTAVALRAVLALGAVHP